MARSLIACCALVALMIMMAAAPAYGGTYYVINTGAQSEWALATSRDNPVNPVVAANNAVAGDTLILINDGGDYTWDNGIYPSQDTTTDGSGQDGSPITWKGEEGTRVVMAAANARGATLKNKSYITLENLVFDDCYIDCRNSAEGATSTGITIKDCWIYPPSDASSWAGIYVTHDHTDFTLQDTVIMGRIGGDRGPSDGVYFTASTGTQTRILIERCTFYGGSHNALDVEGDITDVIIRDCDISNPNHTALNVFSSVDNVLVERCLIRNGGQLCRRDGLTNCDENEYGDQGDQDLAAWAHMCAVIGFDGIFRDNLIQDGGGGIKLDRYAANCRVYNNTLRDNAKAIYGGQGGYDITGNIFKNNLMTNNLIDLDYEGANKAAQISAIYIDVTTAAFNNTWQNNVIYDADANTCYWKTDDDNLGFIAPASLEDMTEFTGNIYTAPTVNQLANGGTWLTTTNGTGSASTTLIVDDATYFTDGMGMVTGDTIQLEGQTVTAVITDITGNTLTLDTPLTWSDEDGVSLPYTGSAPGIGCTIRGHERSSGGFF